MYEFLRNNDLDARNFFDVGASPPGFQRNQFGVSMGGPIQKDNTFIFANYEGLRQSLHQTSETFVPADDARSDEQPEFPLFGSACPAADQVACTAAVTQLLNVWPVPTSANCPGPELSLPNGSPSGIIGCCLQPAADDPRGFRNDAARSHFLEQGLAHRRVHDRRQLRRDGDAGRSVQHGYRQPARAGVQHRRDAPLFANAGEHGAIRLLARSATSSLASRRQARPRPA